MKQLSGYFYVSWSRKSNDDGISSWDWKLRGDRSTYHALFPRAWTVYDGTYSFLVIEITLRYKMNLIITNIALVSFMTSSAIKY
jgi:hypothetical protein